MLKFYIFIILTLFLLSACQNESQIVEPNPQVVSQSSPITNIALEKHNELRQLHFNSSNLIYSLKLEQDAQNYANYLANNGTFIHDKNNRSNMYGENLYRFSGTSKPNLNLIIQSWYDEEKYYNHTTKTCIAGKVCGHYTQIIWKNSKLLGCASAQYTKGSFKGGYVTLCKYYPYGNIIGKNPY